MSFRSKAAASATLALIVVSTVGTTFLFGTRSMSETAPGDGAGRPALPAAATTRQVAGLGMVEPDGGEIDLAALMPGVIAAVHVKEGDTVRRGQIVAELVNDDLKAKLEQAKAVLAIKTAALEKVRNGPRLQEIQQAEAQLRQEEGALTLLQLQHDRRKKLARSGAVAMESFDAAKSALITGQQRRDAAAQAVSLLREGSRPEDVEAAGAEVQLAQHQMEEAEAALSKSLVRASAGGIVLRVYKQPGEALSTQPALPVVQIGDVSKLVVRTQIDEGDIGLLRVGQAARLTAAALGGRSLTGRIDRISPRLGAKTIVAGSPTEKRDARVLDVIVALDSDARLPISLRMDVYIDLDSGPVSSIGGDSSLSGSWDLRL